MQESMRLLLKLHMLVKNDCSVLRGLGDGKVQFKVFLIIEVDFRVVVDLVVVDLVVVIEFEIDFAVEVEVVLDVNLEL